MALRLLARREHSTRELAVKLRSRGLETAWIDDALEALAAEGLLSDARYAETYARARAQRGYGPVRIGQALREAGVDAGLIARTLAGEAADWAEQLARARRKRFGAAPPADAGARARERRFLLQRGFTAEQIDAHLRNL